MKNLCNGYDLHIAHGLLSVRTRTYLILRSTWRYYSEVAKFDREILISINFPLDFQVIRILKKRKEGRKETLIGNARSTSTLFPIFQSRLIPPPRYYRGSTNEIHFAPALFRTIIQDSYANEYSWNGDLTRRNISNFIFNRQARVY